jgi:hypothetical protein
MHEHALAGGAIDAATTASAPMAMRRFITGVYPFQNVFRVTMRP